MKDEKQKEQSAIVGEATSETVDEYIEVEFLLAELKGIEKQMDTVENCLDIYKRVLKETMTAHDAVCDAPKAIAHVMDIRRTILRRLKSLCWHFED